MATDQLSEAGAVAPDGWVPVDRRWLGLDRRTIAPALVVLVLAVVTVMIIPAIDRAIPVGRPVAVGERIGLSGNVQFAPASGWTVVEGVAVGDATRSGGYPDAAEVVNGAVSFSVTTGDFRGTPLQLLAQIESNHERAGSRGVRISGDPTAVRTSSGAVGAATQIRGATTTGLIAAFVLDGVGVEVVVTGPFRAPNRVGDDVASMISSVGPMAEADR